MNNTLIESRVYSREEFITAGMIHIIYISEHCYSTLAMSDWSDIQFASFFKEMQTEIAKIFIFLPYRDHTRKGQITQLANRLVLLISSLFAKSFKKYLTPLC